MLFFGQYTPLFQNFLIVSAQPVNARNAEQIPGSELFEHGLILRALKILARQFVHENAV